MKFRRLLYIVLGSVAAFIEVVGVPGSLIKSNWNLGDTIAEQVGAVIGYSLFGIAAFIFFRAANSVNKKMKAKKSDEEFSFFLKD